MLRLALRLSHERPWSPRLVVGVVSLGWACVSCVCASVMWAQDAQPHDRDQPPVHEQALEADRPHVPEARSTVGKGRLLFEGGHTFTTTHVQGLTRHSHMYPEALLRYGLTTGFEVRLGQNALSQQDSGARGTTTLHGAQDLELGVKLALTDQHTLVPESAVILRLTVPTGSRGVSADAVLPGINYDLSWHMLPERLSIEGVLSATRARDEAGRLFVRLAQGLTGVCTLTAHLEAFTDWYAFYAASAGGAGPGAQHYAVGGLVYVLTPHVALDIRAGGGLTKAADHFFAGAGLALRY